MNGPRVSVISAFYNRATHLDETIGCLLGQSFRDLEVVIVDDGSSDDTAERLRAIADPRLRPLIGPNAGFTRAMNAAIATCRGDYVAIHGSGDLSLRDRIARQAAYLDANPAVGVVGCRWREPNRDVGPRHSVERGPLLPVLLRRNPFAHGDVMFRRTLFEAVGGYRAIFTYAQDRDLWLRIGRLTGCDYAVLPELLYVRRFPEDGVSRDPHRLLMQRRLSQFAVQCAAAAAPDGRDWLDRYGPAALLLLRPTPLVAHKLLAEGLRWLRDGRGEGAALLLAAALAEHRDIRTRTGAAIARMAARPSLRRPIMAALRLLSPRAVTRDDPIGDELFEGAISPAASPGT